MKLINKILKVLICFILFISLLASCSANPSAVNSSSESFSENIMRVHYIDVGQADSILIQVNNKNMLIDAGDKDHKDTVVNYLKAHGVRKLDMVVATHPHEDHIGGMTEVINKFPISKFYAPKVTASTKVFENMIAALKNKNNKIVVAKAGVSFDLGENVVCDIIAPSSDKYDDLNNYSAVVKVTYKNNKFLFMGDAEKLSEKEILSSKEDISSDVIKIGHHGSSSSTSKEFIQKVNPKISIISCGKNNDYGHPHKETLSTLKTINTKIYRTDLDGSILITSDGNKIVKK